jgi:hypothetical protein
MQNFQHPKMSNNNSRKKEPTTTGKDNATTKVVAKKSCTGATQKAAVQRSNKKKEKGITGKKVDITNAVVLGQRNQSFNNPQFQYLFLRILRMR